MFTPDIPEVRDLLPVFAKAVACPDKYAEYPFQKLFSRYFSPYTVPEQCRVGGGGGWWKLLRSW